MRRRPRRSPGRSCGTPGRRCAGGPTPAAPWRSRACCKRRTPGFLLREGPRGRPGRPGPDDPPSVRRSRPRRARSYRRRRPGGRAEASPVRITPERSPATAAGGRAGGDVPGPVRAGQAGEVGVALLAVGRERGHQVAAGVEPLGLAQGVAGDRDVVDPEPARAEQLEPEPGRVEARRRGAARPGRPSRPSRAGPATSSWRAYGRPADCPSIRTRTRASGRSARSQARIVRVDRPSGRNGSLTTAAGPPRASSRRLPRPECGRSRSTSAEPPRRRRPPSPATPGAGRDGGELDRVGLEPGVGRARSGRGRRARPPGAGRAAPGRRRGRRTGPSSRRGPPGRGSGVTEATRTSGEPTRAAATPNGGSSSTSRVSPAARLRVEPDAPAEVVDRRARRAPGARSRGGSGRACRWPAPGTCRAPTGSPGPPRPRGASARAGRPAGRAGAAKTRANRRSRSSWPATLARGQDDPPGVERRQGVAQRLVAGGALGHRAGREPGRAGRASVGLGVRRPRPRAGRPGRAGRRPGRRARGWWPGRGRGRRSRARRPGRRSGPPRRRPGGQVEADAPPGLARAEPGEVDPPGLVAGRAGLEAGGRRRPGPRPARPCRAASASSA